MPLKILNSNTKIRFYMSSNQTSTTKRNNLRPLTPKINNLCRHTLDSTCQIQKLKLSDLNNLCHIINNKKPRMNKTFLFQIIFLPLTLQKFPKRYYTSILEQRIIPYSSLPIIFYGHIWYPMKKTDNY